MGKILIVYYTRTGNTERVARALAEKLDADIEKIRERADRHGFWAYWRTGFESLFGSPAEIEPLEHDPADYDIVVLGTPVWTQRPSTPARAFIAANSDKLKKIACFCTLGGMGAAKTLAMMAEAAGKPAFATFSATEPELKSGAWKEGLERFAEAVGKAA